MHKITLLVGLHEGNGQLEKTSWPSSQSLAQQCAEVTERRDSPLRLHDDYNNDETKGSWNSNESCIINSQQFLQRPIGTRSNLQ